LTSHPQHRLAGELFADYGALLSFELDPASTASIFSIASLRRPSSNLGDNRTWRFRSRTRFFTKWGRNAASMGIADSLIRLSSASRTATT
jgi:O-acetylhomoserine (thiol)-lyase